MIYKDKFKFWGASTVGAKGQVVIPAEAREAFGIQEGDKILMLSPPNKAGIIAVKPEVIERFMQQMQSDIQEVLTTDDDNEEK